MDDTVLYLAADGKWYFWNEDGTDLIGPYTNEADTIKAFNHYCDTLLKQENIDD